MCSLLFGWGFLEPSIIDPHNEALNNVMLRIKLEEAFTLAAHIIIVGV